MKSLYTFILFAVFFSFKTFGQSRFYSVPVVVTDQNLRDSVLVAGRIDLDFPVDGKVFLQFDGEAYGDPGDRIFLAANTYPDWEPNNGNVSIRSNITGEGKCFSHTQTFPVTAGPNSFYAVAHNYVDAGGNGIASVYGTFSVEFIPDLSEVIAESSIASSEFDATSPIAYDSITIHATGAGKIEVRVNGDAYCSYDDIFVTGISATKNWNYTVPGAIALERDNTDFQYVVYSNTRVFNVPGPGTYTYYAMVEQAYEKDGNGLFYVYSNLHARYYPNEADNLLANKSIEKENLNLTSTLRILDSLKLDITEPGKVEVRFDGGIQSALNKSILLAANNTQSYELEEGSVIIQTTDADIDRHTFVHTQVFDVVPGEHTYYIMAQSYLGSGSTSVDIDGNFLVKFYPQGFVSATDDFTEVAFDVWPNPAIDRIHVQYETKNAPMDISIYDLNGQLILEAGSIVAENEMDISMLIPGMYIVEVSNGKERGYKKLVVE